MRYLPLFALFAGCELFIPKIPVCGDTILDPNEACDDGDNEDTDDCTSLCNLPQCGDGFLQSGELCDDGNTSDNDGCKGDCSAIEVCGDGIVQGTLNEQCDDGNTAPNDGCNAQCLNEFCGDGVVQPDEFCDDGGSPGECRDDCAALESCGNSAIDPGEVCDDGRQCANGSDCDVDDDCQGSLCLARSGDGCRSDCTGIEICGDGRVDKILELPRRIRFESLATNCDLGLPPEISFTLNGTEFTLPAATSRSCQCLFELSPNNGATQIESFTTTNLGALSLLNANNNQLSVSTAQLNNLFFSWAKLTISSDNHQQEIVIFDSAPTGSAESDINQLCIAGATAEEVTQGVTFDLNLGEECDDGNTNNNDGCSNNCILSRCGDGILDAGELCDDGNTAPFDSCPFNCQPLALSLDDVVVDRVDGADLEILINQGAASEAAVVGINVTFLDNTGATLGAPLFLQLEDTLKTLSKDDLAGVRARSRNQFQQLFVQNPELAAATDVSLTIVDRVDRESTPLIAPLTDATCGDNINDATEECDDGNTNPADGCSAHCQIPRFQLNFFVAGRSGDNDDPILDDFVFFLQIDAVEGGVSELRTEILNAQGQLLTPSFDLVALQPDIATQEGSINVILSVPDFLVNAFASAQSVSARVANPQQGLESNELFSELPSTVCGDGERLFPLELCDDGNNIDGDGCSAVCGIDCSVSPAKNGAAALASIVVFLLGLGWMRRRRD